LSRQHPSAPERKTELILISGGGRCGDYVFSPETTAGAVKPFWRSYSRAENGFTLGPMTETMSMVSGGFTAVSSRFQAVSVFRETVGFSFGFAGVSPSRIPIKSAVSARFRPRPSK
jgi:hypothetical protein